MAGDSRAKILEHLRRGLKKSALFAHHLGEEPLVIPVRREMRPAGGRVESWRGEELVSKFTREAGNAMANVYVARSGEDALEYIAGAAARSAAKIAARWSEGLPLAEMIDSALAGVEVITPAAGEWQSKIAEAEVGLTGADYAVAETGSIVLIAGPGKPASPSLMPPIHLALVRKSSILADLDELFSAIRARAGGDSLIDPQINMITGPSRTGDIEQTLTLGAHGPKELHLIILPEL